MGVLGVNAARKLARGCIGYGDGEWKRKG